MENKPIFEQKCPSCGAPLKYNPTLKKLECEFCGTTVDIENSSSSSSITRQKRDEALKKIKPLPIYNCVSCGAEVLVSQESGALTCPYCQNNIVLTKQFSGDIQPDGIIPFQITPDALPKAVQNFYKDKPLLSKRFFSESRMGKVTGIYVPFWVFDCDVSGHIDYNGYHDGPPVRMGDFIITETKQYILQREVFMKFENLSIDASQKMRDDLMDSVCPYDLKDLKPFDVSYLAGYVADRFDQTSEEMRKRNDYRVLNTADEAAMRYSTGDFVRVTTKLNGLQPNILRSRYVLFPMYLFHIEFGNKNYEYAVNGQNGKVIGMLPEDKSVEIMYYLKFFALGFLFVAIILFVVFVLGGN